MGYVITEDGEGDADDHGDRLGARESCDASEGRQTAAGGGNRS